MWRAVREETIFYSFFNWSYRTEAENKSVQEGFMAISICHTFFSYKYKISEDLEIPNVNWVWSVSNRQFISCTHSLITLCERKKKLYVLQLSITVEIQNTTAWRSSQGNRNVGLRSCPLQKRTPSEIPVKFLIQVYFNFFLFFGSRHLPSLQPDYSFSHHLITLLC